MSIRAIELYLSLRGKQMQVIHNLITASDDIIQRDSRRFRPYHSLEARNINEIYSTILPLAEKCSSILDVGCNLGAAITFLRRAGWSGTYVGTDIQQGFIDTAKDINKSEIFICGDCFDVIDDLKKSTKFDLVICLGLSHVFIEPFSLYRALASITNNIIVLDSKDIHVDMDGKALHTPHPFTLMSVNSACPVANKSSDTFTDVRGHGCAITPQYVDLFMSTLNFTNINIDTSILRSGVYDPNPVRYRVMQAFKKTNNTKNDTLQDNLKNEKNMLRWR